MHQELLAIPPLPVLAAAVASCFLILLPMIPLDELCNLDEAKINPSSSESSVSVGVVTELRGKPTSLR